LEPCPPSPFRLWRVSLRCFASEGWWSQTESNRRPHACKARALPTELWPLLRPCRASEGMPSSADGLPAVARAAASPAFALQASARQPSLLRERRLVGPGRLELPTLRLSGVRSNQLSYGPPIGARARARALPRGSRSRRLGAPMKGPPKATLSEERETKTAATCTCSYCSTTTE
jgi:hypothetical protein